MSVAQRRCYSLSALPLRGSEFEVKINVPVLKEGAFVAQSIATYPIARAIRKLGALNATQVAGVEAAVFFKWLGRSAQLRAV